MYEVIQFFTDLQDFNHPYNVGDVFPREGRSVSEERLSELSGSQNKQHKPLIKLVEQKTQEEPEDKPKYTKTEINRMSKSDLVSLGTLFGIPDADDLSGTKLKESLIEYLGL